MSKNKEQKEQEQKEEQRLAQVKQDYENYQVRIGERIAKGEQNIETKSYEAWVRKAKRIDANGEITEIEVSGDSGETKKEKFKRLIDSRMTKALNDLDLIQNLSAPQYEPYDTEKIVNALRLKVLDIENSFKSQKKEEPKIFNL